MEANLQHEDLLIKLRAKLNEQKIKLWEPPYNDPDNSVSKSLEDLAKKLSPEVSVDYNTVLQGLHELQLHSVDRSKANEAFKETGIATFRVKVVLSREKPKMLKIQMKLQVIGKELIDVVSSDINVPSSRVKLICNGKVIKPSPSLEEQGLKNGSQLMALIMAETPEEIKAEDDMYKEMASTRDDAALLSEYMDFQPDNEYMRLEDQSGATVDLPASERRFIVVGLALHERGRGVAKERNYPLAVLLLLEADRQFSECSSTVLKKVDNWAVLQLDIAWCYLCLQNLASASDAAARLDKAEKAFKSSYGENYERLIALKGTAANERVLLMRLYLLQGIVAYHQNKREQARRLLDKAEDELNVLKVDETSVTALMELGWSRGQALTGLRAASGDRDRAHHYLEDMKRERDQARQRHREQRLFGVCTDGSPVNQQFVSALVNMGYSRRTAVSALRASNNHVAEAVRLIQEQPDDLTESEETSEETSTSSESLVEADNKLVAELEAMGYSAKDSRLALSLCVNQLDKAVEMLLSCGGHIQDDLANSSNPSTSAGVNRKRKQKKKETEKKETEKKRKAREERRKALERLTSSIKTEEDDHLDTTLVEEEEFLVQYKSLL